jgi:hypothetical protein
VCCGHASITRRCAFTLAERDEARLADGNVAEPNEVLRVCLRLIRSPNRRRDRGNDSVAAREQPASDREQRAADEDPADSGRRDTQQHRTAVRIVEAVDVRTAPARVGDFH